RAGCLLDELPGGLGTRDVLERVGNRRESVLEAIQQRIRSNSHKSLHPYYLSYEVSPRPDLARSDNFMTWFMTQRNINVALQYANLGRKLAIIAQIPWNQAFFG